MKLQITTQDFITYFKETQKTIAEKKDYITELDSATGDGDHWVNVNMGFEKITVLSEELKSLSLADMFKKVGMTMYSAVGGSSGALYGSGYMAAGKACVGKDYLDVENLYIVYASMLEEIMKRGKTQPGQKTMVDTLYRALEVYKKELEANKSEEEVIEGFIEGAHRGAESTKEMEAVKGRASYRTDKGVGYLDPGAVTMALQLECLGNVVLDKINSVK